MGMFGYMTDIDRVENRDMKQIDIRAEGDMQTLLFTFLSEWLELYGTEDYFVARKIEINLFDRKELRIIARGYGEVFDLARHTQGTEVKAITYSNMQIHEEAATHDVYVIVDIWKGHVRVYVCIRTCYALFSLDPSEISVSFHLPFY